MKYDWTEIERLAEHLTAEEIVELKKLSPVGKAAMRRIENLVTEKHLKAKYNAKLAIRNRAVNGDLSALKSIASYQDDTAGEWITQSQYARKYGITRQAVSKAVAEGRLVRRDGLVNGAFDCRTPKSDSESLVDLRKEKIRTEIRVLTLRDAQEKERIGDEAVAEYHDGISYIFRELRDGIQRLGLSTEVTTKLRSLFAEAREKLDKVR